MASYIYKTKPYRYQHEAVRRALKQGYIGLLFEPGCGKSKVIVDWVSCLSIKEGPQRVLIICPLSVVGVWEDEFADHCPVPYSYDTLGPKDESLARHRNPKQVQVLVINYDLAWRRKALLARFDATVVVADESHRIKRPSTKRSWYLRSHNRVPHRAILTGTPTPRSFLDIYGQWVFLNRKRFGTNFAEFKRNYIRYGGYMNRQVQGYLNVKELKQKIDADAIIQDKSPLDLPPRMYQRVPVVLEPEAWKAYQKMAYELFLELKNGDVSDAANVVVKILRLQQITGGWIKSDEGNIHQISEVKIKSAQERLEDEWNGNERVVTFARFRPEVQALTDFGLRSGVPTYMLAGGVRRQDRDDMRRRFQAEDGPSVFIAQIQTGGLGITLHKAAEVLFYSVTHSLDDYIQACDRVHRIGQDRPVRYQHLVGVKTIDIDIYAALRQKKRIQDIVMMNPKKFAAKLAKDLDLGFD